MLIHVACGYCTEEGRYRTFPSSHKVLMAVSLQSISHINECQSNPFNMWIRSALTWSLQWWRLKSWVSGDLGGPVWPQSSLYYQSCSICSLPSCYMVPLLVSQNHQAASHLRDSKGIVLSVWSELPDSFFLHLVILTHISYLMPTKFSHYTLSDSTRVPHLHFHKMVKFFLSPS